MSWEEDVMSDVMGDDWEQWICPIKGPAGMDLCYVDRNSEECRKCEEDFFIQGEIIWSKDRSQV